MIPAQRAHLHVAGNSHPGMSGKNNEDRFGVSTYWLNESQKTPVLLTVVADGIGGHRAGEVAAGIAVDTITQVVASSDLKEPPETLRRAIIQASQAIYKQSEKDEEQRGMGATCACTLIIADRLYTASVGDSRIYLIRDRVIRQLSIDHTWVQEALDQGALTMPIPVKGDGKIPLQETDRWELAVCSLTIGAEWYRPDSSGLSWHAEAHVGRVKNVQKIKC